MKNRLVYYIIIWLIGAIILPIILQSGYIFAIDQALSTNGWIPKMGSNNYWVWWVSQLFVYLSIPIWLLEKLLVVMTFTLPVIGVYLYFKRFVELQSSSALFFALSFSIFNPMLYSRFLDGQVNIYVFYALFPLFIYFTKSFFHYKTIVSALILWLWSILLILTTLHATYFVFFVILIFSLWHIREIYRDRQLLHIGLGFIAICSLQLLWLLPLFTSPEDKVFSTVSQIESFDSAQQSAFANLPQDKNPYREILSMRGYWWDYENRFVESHDIFNDESKNDWIYFIWAIIVVWIIYAYKNKTSDRYIFLALWVLWFVLSLWVTNETLFSPLNALLYEYLPYYAGFREPQKFVLFLIVAYIYFWYFGIIAIWELLQRFKIQKYVASIVLMLSIAAPVLYNFNMIFGFRGQVSVQEYPQQWQDVRDYLAENSCEDCSYETLVFPWHGYMSISWTYKIIPTWVVRYLWENILYGDTIEIGSVYSSSTRAESKVIEKYIWPEWLLRSKPDIENYEQFLQDLKTIGIQNIVLLKESDYAWYQKILESMRELNLLEIALENSMIHIYTIK